VRNYSRTQKIEINRYDNQLNHEWNNIMTMCNLVETNERGRKQVTYNIEK
jgi:phosphate uptake regulator